LSVSPDRHPHSEGISPHCETGLVIHNQSRTRTGYRSGRIRQPYDVTATYYWWPPILGTRVPSLITPI
jgi:hypothetical protein